MSRGIAGLQDSELQLLLELMERDEELRQLLSPEEQLHGHAVPRSAFPNFFFAAVPVFLVDDVAETASYYQRVLGFEVDFIHGDPPTFACVARNNAMINLSKAEPPGTRTSATAAGSGGGHDAYIIVTGIDDTFADMKQRGATIIREPAWREYGMREFEIEDCNRYRLTLAEGVFGQGGGP